MSEDQMNQRIEEDQFYTNLFVHSGNWSTPTPNNDEYLRWEKIKGFLPDILKKLSDVNRQSVRILDVGCGRGWLTNLLSNYGYCEGIEPVEPVVEYGRKLFPHLNLYCGLPEELLSRKDFQPYDLIVTSEVIEHIPHAQKIHFVDTLQQLLNPNGAVILTTPRAEVWDQWKAVSTPNQPVEDWITEQDLLDIFQKRSFKKLGHERIYFDLPNFQYVQTWPSENTDISNDIIALYQIWAFGFGPIFQGRLNQVQSFDNEGELQGTKLEANGPMSLNVMTSPSVEVGKVERSSKGQNPLVSVIVPTFNRPSTLKVALESIVQQSLVDYEIIVINDAGANVEDIVTSFNTRNNVTYIRHGKNCGLAAARNSGLAVARGKYIAYLDDDDRFASHHLDTLVKELEQSHYQVAYTDAWQIVQKKEHGEYLEVGRSVPYSRDFNKDMLLLTNCFPVLCMMHERACLEKTGNFDETLTTHEDWDLWIRLSRHYNFVHIKETTAEFTWRTDGSSMTSRISEDFLRTKKLIYKKYDKYFDAQPNLISVRDRELRNLEKKVNSDSFECSIIIPVFNQIELTKQCLTHLVEVTTEISYEVVIVDNNSSDGTREFLESLGGDVQIIRNDSNLGFAKACNQGARTAKGKYLVFLNNDTIPQEGWLRPLVEEADTNADVAVVGSKLLYPNNTIQHAGVVFCRRGLVPYHIFSGSAGNLPAANRRRELQAVTAACMLVKRDSFNKFEGFDEGFVNGFEDVDFCLKVRRSGEKIVYQPQSVLYHLEHQTAGRKDIKCEGDNFSRLMERWEDKIYADEDIYYVSEGYKNHQYVDDGIVRTRVSSLDGEDEKAQWTRLAHVQKLLFQRMFSEDETKSQRNDLELRDLFVDVSQWPQDREVLAWGAGLCDRLSYSEYGEGFWARLLDVEQSCEAHENLARYALNKNELSNAEEHIQALLDTDACNGVAHWLRGVLLMQLEQYSNASKSFELAIKYGFDSLKAGKGLGMAYLGMGNADKTWVEYEKLLSALPDDVEVMNGFIQAGTALERWGELSKILSRFLERNPTNVDLRFTLAGVEFRAGHLQKAREQLLWLRLIESDFVGLEDLEKLLSTPQTSNNLLSVH